MVGGGGNIALGLSSSLCPVTSGSLAHFQDLSFFICTMGRITLIQHLGEAWWEQGPARLL